MMLLIAILWKWSREFQIQDTLTGKSFTLGSNQK
jgi:hypothetical protein